jgi:hypothetical protein
MTRLILLLRALVWLLWLPLAVITATLYGFLDVLEALDDLLAEQDAQRKEARARAAFTLEEAA